ncbi:MAG TPA: hypothetical protein VNG33_22675 [Polyangiaceae bacterium]|nr:hypothetical protein [Polyangiaceae bacterium]
MADPPDAPNIPAPGQKFVEPAPKGAAVSADAAATELPLPYEAWRGTGFAPPNDAAPRDVPPPLARPREHARRPFELSAALATFLPSCGSGTLDDRGCLSVSPGAGVDVALLYRVGAFFAFGAEGALSGFGDGAHGVLSKAGGGARFFGVVGRVYFADDGVWDPYLALTLGAGTLELRDAAARARESTTGLGGRVAGGIDYVFGSRLRIGPAASFAHWVAWREQACASDICADAPAIYGRLLGFATLGIRVTGSFGDAL